MSELGPVDRFAVTGSCGGFLHPVAAQCPFRADADVVGEQPLQLPGAAPDDVDQLFHAHERAVGHDRVDDRRDQLRVWIGLGHPSAGEPVFDHVDHLVDAGRPDWPSTRLPAVRIDIATDDLEAAERQLLELGATRPGHPADTDQWIFMADPAGNPICLTAVY